MILWLALIPAIFLAMLAMERLEERLVPNSAAQQQEPEPRGPDGSDHLPGAPEEVAAAR